MIDFKTIIRKYIDLPPAQRQELLLGLNEDAFALGRLYSLLSGKDSRMVLRILADACKKKQAALTLHTLETEQGLIKDQLKGSDAKARKTAASLIGLCCAENYTSSLLDALEKEETEFVRPSIILALGKTKSPKAYDYLKSYKPQGTVNKHRAEEAEALLKALSSLSPKKPQAVKPDIRGFSLLLTCSAGQTGLTKEELDEQEMRYWDYEYARDMLLVQTGDYQNVFACRTFFEALILLGKCPGNLQSLTAFLQNMKFKDSIKALFKGKARGYRIEVKGAGLKHEDRRKIIETALGAIDIPDVANSPSSYAFELRILAEKNLFIILIKPSDKLDTRFAYREKTLPASIHPVTAACIMRHIFPYLKRGAAVFDPFCGSGAMLFERSFIKPCTSLTGTDKEKYAISCAMHNERIAKTGAHFLHCDILEFEPMERYDEIISNMPFGHRVGTHENNEALYYGFVKAMDRLLKPKGTAFLFTNDKLLMRDLIQKDDTFKILNETVFNAGNLHPSLFIIMRK